VTPLNAIEMPKEVPSRVKRASPADLCQARCSRSSHTPPRQAALPPAKPRPRAKPQSRQTWDLRPWATRPVKSQLYKRR
jgi:hypothetical protein